LRQYASLPFVDRFDGVQVRIKTDCHCRRASELSRLCFVTRQSLQDVLAALRSAGFVKDANRPPRGRARSLELTTAGTKRLAAAQSAVMGVESAMIDGISPGARQQLAASLTRCAENLEASL